MPESPLAKKNRKTTVSMASYEAIKVND